jgi:hypothetical protein
MIMYPRGETRLPELLPSRSLPRSLPESSSQDQLTYGDPDPERGLSVTVDTRIQLAERDKVIVTVTEHAVSLCYVL